jgi:xylulokinase
MAQKYLLGIDAGTTGCKTCVFDLDGNVIGTDYREYPCYYPNPGWVEQIPEDMVPALFESCKSAIAQSKVNPKDITAMAISSQGSVFGPLDKEGKLLYPFIGWQDARGVGYIEDFRKNKYLDNKKYYQITGYPIATVPCITKYMWFKTNKPDLFEKTAVIAHQQSYLLKAFGAEDWKVEDTATGSRTGVYDVSKKDWSKEVLDSIGIDIKLFPPIFNGTKGKVVGKISHDISIQTGLAEGTLICVGAMDQNCSTMGAGLVKEGTAISVMGTYGAIYVVLDNDIRDPNGTLIFKNNTGPENFTVESASVASASAYRWFRDTFCKTEKVVGDEIGVDYYEIINRGIESVPPGANKITFIPYLQGAGSGSRNDPYARGCFLGLTLGTTKKELGRACMEGITMEMRDNFEAIRRAGIKVDNVRIVGGAVKSRMWSQMQADMYKTPVQSLVAGETGCLGAALYAGVAAGVYKDFFEATEKAVRIKETIDPNPSNYGAYDEAYERFILGYEGLRNINYFKKINE